MARWRKLTEVELSIVMGETHFGFFPDEVRAYGFRPGALAAQALELDLAFDLNEDPTLPLVYSLDDLAATLTTRDRVRIR